MIFYKGVLRSFLDDKFIPGTVTTNLGEAMLWADRIRGKKTKGPSKHLTHGESCVIEVYFDESKLLTHDEFQRAGVREHDRLSCWTSQAKVKAQINIKAEYVVLKDEEIYSKFSLSNHNLNK
jgi:heterodisulfide reductase subunit B